MGLERSPLWYLSPRIPLGRRLFALAVLALGLVVALFALDLAFGIISWLLLKVPILGGLRAIVLDWILRARERV